MKKIIVLGSLLLIALFTYSSQKQLIKQIDIYNKNEATQKQLLINNTDHQKHKFDKPMHITIKIYDKKQKIKPFSTNRKGKIIYIKNNKKTQTIVFY
jgi:hypothetical protein